MEPSVEGVLLVCSNGSTPLNEMAAMSIYGKKHLKFFFSRTKKALRLNLGMQHWGLKLYQVCSKEDPWMIFDLFTAMSNLHPYAFVWGNLKNYFMY